jgi:hypothetical protein
MVNTVQGWTGLPMRSKCLKYDVPSSTCIPLGANGKQQYGPISYKNGDGYTMVATSESGTVTYTLTFTEFNKTEKDAFGNDRNLEKFRTAADSTLTKDVYGSSDYLPHFSALLAPTPRHAIVTPVASALPFGPPTGAPFHTTSHLSCSAVRRQRHILRPREPRRRLHARLRARLPQANWTVPLSPSLSRSVSPSLPRSLSLSLFPSLPPSLPPSLSLPLPSPAPHLLPIQPSPLSLISLSLSLSRARARVLEHMNTLFYYSNHSDYALLPFPVLHTLASALSQPETECQRDTRCPPLPSMRPTCTAGEIGPMARPPYWG